MIDSWYLFGAGGFGHECMDILHSHLGSDTDFKTSFLVDEAYFNPKLDSSITCFSSELIAYLTVAVGEPSLRAQMLARVEKSKLKLRSIISKHAFVSQKAIIKDGGIIAPFCSVQATAQLERNVALNTASIVGHDVHVGESSVISSQANIGGGTKIGKSAYIGMGASVKEGLTIGDNTIIGMGSVVHRDIPDNVIAMGNPARVLKQNTNKQVFK